jgi:hypothetical protein
MAASIALRAQGQAQATPAAAPPPQTARQALIEMFVGKADDAFERHLPQAAHKVLIGKGKLPQMSFVRQISTIGRQISTRGGRFETFDEGSLLLVSEPEGTHEKIEVLIEQDSLMGEEDIIEVSVHSYENGKPEFIPVLPRLSFTMKQEDEIWKLSEVTVSGRVPLEDADYLTGVRKKQDEMNETMASMRLTMVTNTETAYAAKHPEQGYTCKMTELFSNPPTEEPGGGESSAGEGTSISGQEESNGYHFALSGCEGTPASKFQVTAVPTDLESDLKAFCTDQSGKQRYSADGKGPACLSHGEPLKSNSTSDSMGAGVSID